MKSENVLAFSSQWLLVQLRLLQMYRSVKVFKIINFVKNATENYSIKVSSENLSNIHDNYSNLIEMNIQLQLLIEIIYFFVFMILRILFLLLFSVQ